MSGPVLVIGATGALGGKVVSELIVNGKAVRALVRPASDAARLTAQGVEVVRGDMLDPASLTAAMAGADAVITTAAGYTRGGKEALAIDTTGNNNLAEAARLVGVRRFVLTSILTSDQAPGVPHFWHKKLAEDQLEERGVPFVALRPGAFLDAVARSGGGALEKNRLTWVGRPDVPLTFVLTTDLARHLAAAVDADVHDGERVDIGWDRPVAVREVADLMSTRAGRRIRVRALPVRVAAAAGLVSSPFAPIVKDMASMFCYFESGRYVANTHRQAQLFGPVPTAEDAVIDFVDDLTGSDGPSRVAPVRT